MTREESEDARLTTGDVAALLDVSADTVVRIPAERLDFWRTPGGHRRYRRADVAAYAATWLGRDLPDPDGA